MIILGLIYLPWRLKMKLCDRCILLSGIPHLDLSEDQMLDKLEKAEERGW